MYIDVLVSKLFHDEVPETFPILSAILLPIKSSAASAAFRISLFEVVLSVPLKFLPAFLPIYFLLFLAKDKN